MRFFQVREALQNGYNITTLPLRVTFYARVSTEKEEQLNSLENQKKYFEEYIKENKNWQYVPGYIDEGLSGSSVKKRKSFLKMIEDAKSHCFDLIITKEVSRFSRNLSDSIFYTQELIKSDVGVFFQTNGIMTYDANAEFILNMMGSVAQEEVKRLSARIKWGHHKAIKRGRVLGSIITGYKKEKAKLIIDEEAAKKIVTIYELYATGNYGLNKLGKLLYEKGITNSKGNPFDKDTLKRMIENPKYKGYYRGHTTEIIDYKTKERRMIPKEEQIIFKDENIPRIISEELWKKANEVLQTRSILMKKSKGNAKKIECKSRYSGKIICSNHQTAYQRISNSKKKILPKWACSKYVNQGLKSCESPIILEEDFDTILTSIFKKIIPFQKLIEDMMKLYEKVNPNEEKKIKEAIIKQERKKDKLLELNIEGYLSNKEFHEQNRKCDNEIQELKEKLHKRMQIKNKKLLVKEIKKQLEIPENLSKYIEVFVNNITVYKIENNRKKLRVIINFNHISSVPNSLTKKYHLRSKDKILTYLITF